ncbi:MAG: carboxylating nicotinate-nucleotide diphosphorylase [Gammaproteobacteria bacterium]|nr:carboxylating nicotinate-nucleotide diphosphorylase [Gammaproteobacteria bacterium]
MVHAANFRADLPADLASTVRRALSEDVGTRDLSADLLPADQASTAEVLCREEAVLCGTAWFDEVFRQIDASVRVAWRRRDGMDVSGGETVCALSGATRALLTGERTALNFLQLLSGTATATRQCVRIISGTGAVLLDTRKTVPGLRTAQKYAVLCGGGANHRMGLYDAILLKENHIRAAGGVAGAVQRARALHRQVEVEVETLEQLEEAIGAGAHRVLLDNFGLQRLAQAVQHAAGRVKLEASGGIGPENLRAIADTGVDFISMGALTKHVRAVDFSMRFVSG